MKYLIIFFLTFISTSACDQVMDIAPIDLIGCWTDSREENDPESTINVFRPCDYKNFPVSRYRLSINFYENNTSSWLHLADNDAHFIKEGTWTLNEKTGALNVYDLEKKEVFNEEREH